MLTLGVFCLPCFTPASFFFLFVVVFCAGLASLLSYCGSVALGEFLHSKASPTAKPPKQNVSLRKDLIWGSSAAVLAMGVF